MSLRFIIGRAGSGKSRCCLDEIREKLKSEITGAPLIYLVPEQMSFQAEYDLASTPGLNGMIRAQVLSFRRLAWKVLQETGGMSRTHIDGTGIKMALRKIIDRHQNDFKIFARAASQSGFTDQLETIYTEFKRYGVTPDLLLEQVHRFSAKEEDQGTAFLADKLMDLQIIFRELESFMADRYMDSEDYLPLLASKIPYSAYLQRAEVWIDGFNGFTPQEFAVVAALLRKDCRVSVSLTLDRLPENHAVDKLDLFYPTAKTALQLMEVAELHGVEQEASLFLPGEGTCAPRFKDVPSLAHLESEFSNRPPRAFLGKTEGITLSSATSKRAEVDSVARKMLELVRDYGYRWRDMAILLRNPEDYKDLLTTVFSDYEIPYFLDQKRSMLHHPLPELIRSSLEALRFNWPYDAIFRVLKTDLLLQPESGKEGEREIRSKVDILENYVLAYGIEGYRWTNPAPWHYRKYKGLPDGEEAILGELSEIEKRKEEIINTLRGQVTAPLLFLKRNLEKAKTAEEMCRGLYLFLEQIRVPERLEQWSVKARESGKPEKAREHGQAWQAIINMLDQMVEVMGEESLELNEFIQIIDSGLESLRFSLVPPALDQVLIGSMDRSRPPGLRCTFILGINDGVLPSRPKEDGLLAESERDFLVQVGLELAPGSRQRLLEEEFLIYSAFTSPSEQLHLSYPLADEEGKALLPSILIKRIHSIFPGLKEQWMAMEPSDVGEEEQLDFVTVPGPSATYLATALQQWRKGYPLASLWWDVYNKLHELAPVRLSLVLHGLYYQNQEPPLTKETNRSLYGRKLLASVSRLERYKSCPFSQFLSHGLRLQEREIYRLDTPDIGQLFHGALRLFGEHIREQGLGWGSLSSEECQKIASEKVDLLVPRLQREILLSSNRYKYLSRKLKNVVGRAVTVISEHGRRSEFVPLALEMAFGPGETIPPLRFSLPNGCEMELIGRIDRVDGAKGDNGLYLRIIDYKSSAKDLNLTDVYYGLSLQMLTYLDVLVTFAEQFLGEKALPAGVLYFHVHNPLLQKQVPPSLEEIQKLLFKSFKMKGLILADPEVVRLMDMSLDTGNSDMIPVAINKDGAFAKAASVATEEQFAALQSYLRNIVFDAALHITEGDVSISPYRLNKKVPCSYCPYKGVCQFDPLLEGNEYRFLRNDKKEEVWKKIQGSEGGEGDGHE